MSDMFSPYQIDYSVKNTSRTFGFSKKKIIFKFGFANSQAVEAGETGVNCRGSEHEVIFTWSLNSGKRQILADGKDVHYSETGRNGWVDDQVFQHHFTIRVPGLSSELRAHLITQPTSRDVPHIKPFDLRVNGLSYFSMPKLFQLGTPQMITRSVKGKGKNGGRGGGYGRRGRDDDTNIPPEERQAIAAAKLASMRDLAQMQQQQNASSGFTAPPMAPPAAPVQDLLSFDDPAPPPLPQGGAPPYGQQQYANYSLGITTGGAPSPHEYPFAPTAQQSVQPSSVYASQASYGSQPSLQSQQQPNLLSGSFYSQPSVQSAPQPQQHYGQQLYGQPQPPPTSQQQQNPFGLGLQSQKQPSFNSLMSPSNQTVASYQSYGSAPSFAQPPQPQQQQHEPQQMQEQQQPFYGQTAAQPAAPQGFPF